MGSQTKDAAPSSAPMGRDHPSPSAIGQMFSKTCQRLSMRFADPRMEERFLAQYRDDAAQNFRWVSAVGLAIMIGFIWQDSEISPIGYHASNIRIYVAAPIGILSWLLSNREEARRFIEYVIAFFFVTYACSTAAILLVYEPGPYGITSSVGAGNFLILLLALCTCAYLRFWPTFFLCAFTLMIYAGAVYFWTQIDFGEFVFLGDFANAFVAGIIGLINNFLFERTRRKKFEFAERLKTESEHYKQLLFTLVPSQIAERIEHGEFPIADSQAEVTILFADIVGFTAITKEVAPRLLVQLLNELFFEFDVTAEKNKVEKIKTIGDGYMAACGPPLAEDRRTIAVAHLAEEMLLITRMIADKYDVPIKLRVGIHTGSLIAGVIGKNRYTYDMWGESVNLASRMESTGIADRIQISEAAHQRLKSHFQCEPRDAVEVHGVGPVKTYLLGAPFCEVRHKPA